MDENSSSEKSLHKLSALSCAINDGTVSPTLTKRYAMQTNSRLIYVFSHLVKAFLETENEIQKSLAKMGLASADELMIGQNDEMLFSLEDAIEKMSLSDVAEEYFEDDANFASYPNPLYTTSTNMSTASNSFLELENLKDDVVLGFSQRLRQGVDKVLKVLNENLESSPDHGLRELVKRNLELSSEVKQEIERREILTKKLIQTEQDLQRIGNEKGDLEQQLMDYKETKAQLNALQARLEEYGEELANLNGEKDRLSQQKNIFNQSLPQLEQSENSSSSSSSYFSVQNSSSASSSRGNLLQELVGDLDASTRELKRAEQETSHYRKRISELEMALEQLRIEQDHMLEERQAQMEDFQAQIESSQKQVSQYKRFIEEQTQEREAEREEFTHELRKLAELQKEKEKLEQRGKESVQALEEQLAMNYAEKQTLQHEYEQSVAKLTEANKQVADLKQVLNELERTGNKANVAEKQLNEKINRLEKALSSQMKMNEKMQKDRSDRSLQLAHSFLDDMLEKTEQIRCASFEREPRLSFGPSMTIENDSQSRTLSPDTQSELDIDCSFADAQQLENKIKNFYYLIEQLSQQNTQLKTELVDAKNGKRSYECKLQELLQQKQRLEADLNDVRRTKDVLQSELNSKHLQLTSLKIRLDGSMANETVQFKQTVDELKTQLTAEEEKCELLAKRLACATQTAEEHENRLKELLSSLEHAQMEQRRATEESNHLVKSNQELLEQKARLSEELEQLQRKSELEKVDAEQSDIVLPKLFEIILKDKDEEIALLNRKCRQIHGKIKQIIPESRSEDAMCLLSELQFRLQKVENNLEKQETSRRVSRSVQMNKKIGTLPLHLFREDKAVNTDPLEEESLSNNNMIKLAKTVKYLEEEREIVLQQLSEFIIKLEDQCAELASYEKDNEMLRRQLSMGQKEKTTFLVCSPTRDHASLSPVESEFDDLEEEEDEEEEEADADPNLESTLCNTLADVHNQSVELCKLTKVHKAQSVSVLKELIATLPSLIAQNDWDDPKSVQWREKFIRHYPEKELGSLLMLKLGQVHALHQSAMRNVAHYSAQLEYSNDCLKQSEQELNEQRTHIDSQRDALLQYENELKRLRKYSETFLKEKTLYKAEIAKQKGEIDQLRKKLDQVQITNSSQKVHDEHGDLYEKFRRCLNHKKALIFQKKYLVKVLEGLNANGESTLDLLSKFSAISLDNTIQRPLKVNRLRSIVYLVIACGRFVRCIHKTTHSVNQPSHMLTPISKTSSVQSPPETMRNFDHFPMSFNSPLSSTKITKSRSTVNLDTFAQTKVNDTYEPNTLRKVTSISAGSLRKKSSLRKKHEHLEKRPDATAKDSTLEKFFNDLKHLHDDLGLELSTTIASSTNSS